MRQAGGRVQGAESILRPAPTTANERPERLEHRADGRQSTGTQEDLSITTASFFKFFKVYSLDLIGNFQQIVTKFLKILKMIFANFQ